MPSNEREKSKQKASRALGDAIARISAVAPSTPFDALLAAYREIESKHLVDVAGDEESERETRRRIAEAILYSATSKRIAAEEARTYFDHLENLGYTTLEQKSNAYLIYARYCVAVGHHDEASHLLQQLRRDLKAELARKDNALYRDVLTTTEKLLRDTSGRSGDERS